LKLHSRVETVKLREFLMADTSTKRVKFEPFCMVHHQTKFVDKVEIANRYSVSQRTINEWMRGNIIPYIRISYKLVRFDLEKCDVAFQIYEIKSFMDAAIQEKLCRMAAKEKRLP
jgi:hypothetical protein